MIQFLPWLLKAAPFLKSVNWIRVGLISALAVALFVGGCQYANVQNAEQAADVERQTTALIAERVAEMNAEFAIRLEEENVARAQLQGDLTIIRDHRDSLIEGIRNAQLTKPIDSVNIEACLETEDENIKLVIANPFTIEFVSLYNDASKVGGLGEASRPETD